jgi:hypothetical protein
MPAWDLQAIQFNRIVFFLCCKLITLVPVSALLLILLAAPAQTQAQQLSASAVQQIQILLQEKANRTPAQKKISSQLLLAIKQHRDDNDNPTPSLSGIQVHSHGEVIVEITGEVTGTFLQDIEIAGGTILNNPPQFDTLHARLPLTEIEIVAAFPQVRQITHELPLLSNSINTSEGDSSHAADRARTLFQVDGTGVRVGVISDSIEQLASLQASGDLPAIVSVLPGQSGTGTSEGTAMLEIVHDLAPGAELFFCYRTGWQSSVCAEYS